MEMELDDDSDIEINDQATINQTNLALNTVDYSILPSSVISKGGGDGDGDVTEDANDIETEVDMTMTTETVPNNKIATKYCTPSINLTHSIVVDASRHLVSHLQADDLSAGVLPSMAAIAGDITTSVLMKKPVTDATFTIGKGFDDEITTAAVLDEIDKKRHVANSNDSCLLPRHFNITQTLEKLPTNSFIAAFKGERERDMSRTLDVSGRSFLVSALVDNDLRLPQLNISATNVSLRSGSHALNSSSQIQPKQQPLNQSAITSSGGSTLRLPTRLDQVRNVKDLANLVKTMARIEATASMAVTVSTTATSEDGNSLYESIKAGLENLNQNAQNILARRREAVKNAKARYENELASVKNLRQEKENWVLRVQMKKEELERLKADAIKRGNRGAFEFNQEHADTILNELNEYKAKHASLQKEYEEKRRLYENLKETVENTAEILKSLQQGQNEKEGLKNLFQKLFSETHLGFKLGYYDNDTIVILFLFDLIQVEIKGTNIVKDLKSARFGSVSNEQNLDQHATWQTYLNYPLEQILVRSNIDAATDTYASQYKSINMHASNLFRGNKKIPIYLKYCVELVLGEIGIGNIMLSNKKIRHVKDLPMVIYHLILSSNMASRLAVDFEYFATLTADILPKCDFEFKNFMVHLTLISAADNCLYKLKLKVKPAFYYQQAIPFFIEKAEGQYYEPNVQRIRNLIEDQYFENGSIRTYLDRLNQTLNPANIVVEKTINVQ